MAGGGGRYPATLAPLTDAAALLPAALGAACRAATRLAKPPRRAIRPLSRPGEINRILRGGYLALEPDPAEVVRVVTHHAGAARTPAAPDRRAAATLLTERDLSRLHRCGNERCVLLFYDTTKSGTRRWCSLGCMNRARSLRRYRERTQKTGA